LRHGESKTVRVSAILNPKQGEIFGWQLHAKLFFGDRYHLVRQWRMIVVVRTPKLGYWNRHVMSSVFGECSKSRGRTRLALNELFGQLLLQHRILEIRSTLQFEFFAVFWTLSPCPQLVIIRMKRVSSTK
jgi:hypothetical protein